MPRTTVTVEGTQTLTAAAGYRAGPSDHRLVTPLPPPPTIITVVGSGLRVNSLGPLRLSFDLLRVATHQESCDGFAAPRRLLVNDVKFEDVLEKF